MSITAIQNDLTQPSSIFIKSLDGKTLTMPFDPLSKICAYKKEIELREQIPFDAQRLLFAGKQLRENLLLSDYQIYPNATLHLTAKLIGGMRIFVLITDKLLTIEIEIEPEARVNDLKYKIAEKAGVSLGPHKITFRGIQLGDSNKLSDYNIQGGSTVHMVRSMAMGTMTVPFLNMNEEKMITFTKNEPRWKIVQPGLNLLGECNFRVCDAYGKGIRIPKGFGTFNMNKECKTSCCPECQITAINVKNLALFGCFFSIEGSYKDGENKLIVVKKERKQVPNDKLLSFQDHAIDDKYNICEWYSLEIKTEPVVINNSCDETEPLLFDEQVETINGRGCCSCKCTIL